MSARAVGRQAPKLAELGRPPVLAGHHVEIPGADVVGFDGQALSLLADPECGFRLFLEGHVAVDADHLGRLAVRSGVNDRMGADPAQRAVRPDNPKFAVEVGIERQRLQVEYDEMHVVRMDDRKKELAARGQRAVESEQAILRLVPTLIAGRQVVAPGAHAARDKGDAQAPFALAYRFLVLAALVDVAQRADTAQRSSVRTEGYAAGRQHPAYLAGVGPPDPEFGAVGAVRARRVGAAVERHDALAVIGMDQPGKNVVVAFEGDGQSENGIEFRRPLTGSAGGIDVPDADVRRFGRQAQALLALPERAAGAGFSTEIEQFENGAIGQAVAQRGDPEGEGAPDPVVAGQVLLAFMGAAFAERLAHDTLFERPARFWPQQLANVPAHRLRVGAAGQELGDIVDEAAAKAAVEDEYGNHLVLRAAFSGRWGRVSRATGTIKPGCRAA